MIRDEIEKVLKKHGLPGASVALSVGDITEYYNFGYIDDKLNEPYASDQIIRIGCVIKLLIASQVMILHQEKEIDIDEPIAKYIPEVKKLNSVIIQTVTPRQLLNHTSGLPVILDNNGEWASTKNILPILKRWSEEGLFLYSPGENISYSSTGYVLLCLLIEHCRGMDWRKDLKVSIFDRIGVYCHQIEGKKELKFAPDGLKIGSSEIINVDSQNNFMSEIVPADGGALALSSTDLMKFASLFLNDGRNQFGEEILSIESVRVMTSISVFPPAKTGWMKGWGFGWFVYPDDSIGFTGDGFNNHALIRLDLNKNRKLCVVTNYHSAMILFNAIWELLAEPDEVFESSEETRSENDYCETTNLEGKYVNGNRVYMVQKNNTGYSVSVGEIEANLSHINDGFYFAAALGKTPEVHFLRSAYSRENYIWNGLIVLKKC